MKNDSLFSRKSFERNDKYLIDIYDGDLYQNFFNSSEQIRNGVMNGNVFSLLLNSDGIS